MTQIRDKAIIGLVSLCRLEFKTQSHSSAGYPPVPSGTFGRGALALLSKNYQSNLLRSLLDCKYSLIAQLVRALH